jgi:hypothetical protein
MKTLYPQAVRRFPIDAAEIPFPMEEHTPPVTKMYLVMEAIYSDSLEEPYRYCNSLMTSKAV